MKNISTLLFIFLVHYTMYAQNNQVNILSPKASSIMKYGEYPVSLYTGLIDITVPIYTIERNGITVPVELKYHASGIKYDDVSNEAGLGWSLVAGGVIVRTVKGGWDGQYGSYSRDITKVKTCDSDPSSYDNDYLKLREVSNGCQGTNNSELYVGYLDGEMDMYSFSFLKHNGSFCFPFLGSEVDRTAPSTGIFLPNTGMKVVDRSLPDLQLDLRDMDGIFYRFEVKDVDQNKSYKEYYLTKIVSADKADTINFIYDVISSSIYIRRPYINYSASLMTPTTIVHPQSTEKVVTERGGLFYQNLRPPRLVRIDFRGGHLSFEYSVINGNITWDLQYIKRYNNIQSIPLQTVSLIKSQFTNGEKRLDKVNFDSSQGESYDYQFGYDGEPGNINSGAGIDYWGYFNGSYVPYSKRYIPTFDNMPYGMQGTDRNASEFYMQRGILNKITYPTKGYSEFTYEAHKARYSLGTPIVTFGGLRIKEIRNYLADGSLVRKEWYEYGENESGLGIANTFPDIRDFTTESRILVTHADVGSSPHLCRMNLLTTYSTFPKISYFLSGSSVVYTQVAEYISDNTGDYGKTIYQYEVKSDDKFDLYGNTYRQNSTDTYLRTYQWKTGNLLSKTVYKKEGSSYREVHSIQNSYIDINKAEFRNVRVLPYVEFEYNFGGTNLNVPDIKRDFCNYSDYRMYFGGYNSNLSPYDYFNYYITTGLHVLSSSSEMSDGVTTYTSYDAYNESGLPTSISYSTSLGDNIVTNLKYPTDYIDSPYTGMKSVNILTPIIDKVTSKNGIFLKREYSTYQFWYNRFYAPKKYMEQSRNGSSEVRLEYNYDLNKNILEIVRDGVTGEVYLWGYNQTLPIAKLRNLTYSQVASNTTLMQYFNQLQNYTVLNTTLLQNNLKILNANIRSSLPTNAMVTTYTYNPLIGMTSETDPNGMTTFYEYDNAGRLIQIKDNSSKRNEYFDYHYNAVALNLSFTIQFSYDYGSSLNTTAKASGGSEWYSYIWTLKNSSGVTVYSSSASESPFVSVPLQQSGNLTLTCTVTDKMTNESKSRSLTFTVLAAPIEFTDITETKDAYSGHYTVEGYINCAEVVSVDFGMECTTGGGQCTISVGGGSYSFSGHEEQTITRTLPSGSTLVKIELINAIAEAGASICITSAGDYAIGSNSCLSVSE